MHICADTAIPTFLALYALATPFPTSISVPVLPALPNPIFPGFGSTNLTIVQILSQFQLNQLLVTLKAFLDPVVNFLGIAIGSILPNIPGTNFNLLDLLAGTPNAIYNALAALPRSVLLSLPGVLNPIFYGIGAGAIELALAVQGVITGYVVSVITIVVNLFNQAAHALSIGGLSIPTIPSISSLLHMIIPSGTSVPNVITFLQRFSLNELLALVSVPGFPTFPALPDPLIPSMNFPEFNLATGLNLLYISLATFCMTTILQYIQNTLGHFISFAFPKICIDI
jgi:hypothetical protein